MSTPEPPGGLTRIVVRGAGVAGSGFFFTQALTLGFYLVLARLASPEDFGVLAAGSILVGIGSLFAEAGLMAALIQRRDRIEEAASTAVVATLAGGLVLSLVALALAPLVGLYFDSGEVTRVAAAMSGLLVLQAATVVPDALMQRRFSFVRRIVVEPVGVLAFGFVAVVTTAQGLGVWGLVFGLYASGVAQAALAWPLARWRPRTSLMSWATWRELLRFGRPVMSSELIRRVTAELDAALVGRFIGTGSLGQYRYARRFAVQPLMTIVNVIAFVLLPALARIAGDPERFRPAFLRALRWVAVIAFPTSLVFLPIGEPLAVLLLGERWRSAGEALSALCAYSAGGAMVSLASEAFKSAGRPDLLPRVHLVSAAVSAVLMVALLPLGIVGVAAAVSAASLVVAAYALRSVGRIVGVPGRSMLAEIWAPAVAASVAAGALYPLERFVVDAGGHSEATGLVLLAGEVSLGAFLYLGLLAVLAPALARELLSAARNVGKRSRADERASVLER
jgi:O-antigen/teichoic acid export membrane protein